MELDSMVRGTAEEMGEDFFGVADLSAVQEAIVDQGGSMVARFPRAVSIGIVLSDAIVNQLPQRDQLAVAMTYRHHAYDVVNQRLDHIISRLAGMLQQEGHRALPVPASQTVDEERLCGLFSHILAAHLAGLGWIGKSCLLVTPEVGPRVRWATLLTDAPLRVTGEPMEDRAVAANSALTSAQPRPSAVSPSVNRNHGVCASRLASVGSTRIDWQRPWGCQRVGCVCMSARMGEVRGSTNCEACSDWLRPAVHGIDDR